MAHLDEAQHAGMACYEEQMREFDDQSSHLHPAAHADKHESILETAMKKELEVVLKNLPDPNHPQCLRFASLAWDVGEFKMAGRRMLGCGFLKGFAKFFIYTRIFACVEILYGFIRAHSELVSLRW